MFSRWNNWLHAIEKSTIRAHGRRPIRRRLEPRGHWGHEAEQNVRFFYQLLARLNNHQRRPANGSSLNCLRRLGLRSVSNKGSRGWKLQWINCLPKLSLTGRYRNPKMTISTRCQRELSLQTTERLRLNAANSHTDWLNNRLNEWLTDWLSEWLNGWMNDCRPRWLLFVNVKCV